MSSCEVRALRAEIESVKKTLAELEARLSVLESEREADLA